MKFTAVALSLLASASAKAPKHHEYEAVESYTFKEFTKDFNKVSPTYWPGNISF